MADAIFLSAGVPDPKRGPEFAKSADSVAITAAVSALVHVVLGRRLLVWGGHPAITPMILQVAEGMNVDYGSWVKLYQTKHFKDEYPDDNANFKNIIYTDDVDGDREKSLKAMRLRMFQEHGFLAAVFVGGMGGVVDEFDLFRNLQPNATVLPVASTGGASLMLYGRNPIAPADLRDDMDYVALFHRHLGISVKEQRYKRPADQPANVDDRLWKPKATGA